MKILSVTDRKSCGGDFYERIEAIAAAGIWGIILREKDLEEARYYETALRVQKICEAHGIKLIVNSFIKTAREIKADGIHLPFQQFCDKIEAIQDFSLKGVSVHAPEEAKTAEKLGADYMIAGHIFPTACKRDLPPRGLEFLRKTCNAVKIPVFAIGGIHPDNIGAVMECGAAGAAVMSGLMRCTDPVRLLARFAQDH